MNAKAAKRLRCVCRQVYRVDSLRADVRYERRAKRTMRGVFVRIVVSENCSRGLYLKFKRARRDARRAA